MKFCEFTKQNILDHLHFLIIHVSSPFISLDNHEFTVQTTFIHRIMALFAGYRDFMKHCTKIGENNIAK